MRRREVGGGTAGVGDLDGLAVGGDGGGLGRPFWKSEPRTFMVADGRSRGISSVEFAIAGRAHSSWSLAEAG